MTKTQEIGLPLNPLRWEANVGLSILLLCTMLGLEGACSAPESGSHDIVEMIGPDQFRYVTTASVLHPLNSSQGEQTRMVRLDHYLKAQSRCPNGYDILSRTPPRSYGRMRATWDQEWAGDVTYIGKCKP
jgi:hypothetical protein